MQLASLKKVMGEDFYSVVVKSTTIGCIWFLVDYSFVYVLQIFLVIIKATDQINTFIPAYFNVTPALAITLLFSFGIIRGIVQMLRSYLTNALSQHFISKHRLSLSQYAILQGDKEKTSDVIMVFNEVISNTSLTIIKFSELVIATITSIFLFFAALHLAPRELLIAFSLLVITVLPLRLLNKRILEHGNNLLRGWESASETLINSLKNRMLINIYNASQKQISSIQNALDKYRTAYNSYYKILSFKLAYPQMVGICIISLVTFVSIQYFQTPGVKLLAFYFLFIRLAQSCSDITVHLSDIKLHENSTAIMHKWQNKFVRNNLVEISSRASKNGTSQISTLECKDLVIGYDGKSVASIHNISISKGSVLTIKGPSGVGKSTLIATLAGLIPPISGEILYNSKNLTESFSSNYLEKIGYVGPEPFILPATARENLLFANHAEISEQEIWTALEVVGMKEAILSLPNSLDEYLNENTQLSTGQKQRLSFARALLRSPQLLILDEATANLDNEVERKIINNLQKISPEKIIIVVTHRNSYDALTTSEIYLTSKS